ncbi:MAG: hypothetical protein JWM91_1151 [Rhodospirillales bacterium]|nr:hypothetical protein [Rhodospirillales bacterium]
MIEELDVTEVVRAVELVRETYRTSMLRFSGWERPPNSGDELGEAINQLQFRE